MRPIWSNDSPYISAVMQASIDVDEKAPRRLPRRPSASTRAAVERRTKSRSASIVRSCSSRDKLSDAVHGRVVDPSTRLIVSPQDA
jgi:hypothetical protein